MTPSTNDADIEGTKRSYKSKPSNETPNSHVDLEEAAHEEVNQDIFGGQNGKTYRNMSRWDAFFALTTNQLGLGVLSLPAVFRTLGIVPSLIAMAIIGTLTWYTGLELWQFFCRYPSVVNIVDMIRITGGRTWEIIAGVFLLIQLIMTCAAVSVTLSVAFNTLSQHSVCTVGFIGIACIGCWLLCVPRTVKFIAHSGVPCFLSILVSSLIVIISLGVKQPTRAPDQDWKPAITIIGSPTFGETFNACLRISFAFAGNIAFVSYMAEMRDAKRDFPFALRWLFISSGLLYAALAVAIYVLAGEYTTSPALGSAPLVPAKVAYGIILPAVLTTGLSNGHVGIKYIYVLIMQWLGATEQITTNTTKSWTVWMSCVTVFWVICFIVANAIPIFDSILSITSATTMAWFCYGVSALLWFHLNKDRLRGQKQIILLGLNLGIILLAFFINGAGLWSSITELLELFANERSGIRGAFDCGDNSLF